MTHVLLALFNVNKSELIHKFYKSQQLATNKNDWITQVEQVKKDIFINVSEDNIAFLSKTDYENQQGQKKLL